jgi:methionine sulfoxide reductase heme-binding subunit
MPATAVTEHLFWITSRAAGTVALLLSSVAVCVGLLFGGKLGKGRPDLRPLHEALSLATVVALVVHAVALLGDRFLSPTLA